MNNHKERWHAFCQDVCDALEKHVLTLPDSPERFSMGMDCGIDLLCTVVLVHEDEECAVEDEFTAQAVKFKFMRRLRRMREDQKQAEKLRH